MVFFNKSTIAYITCHPTTFTAKICPCKGPVHLHSELIPQHICYEANFLLFSTPGSRQVVYGKINKRGSTSLYLHLPKDPAEQDHNQIVNPGINRVVFLFSSAGFLHECMLQCGRTYSLVETKPQY